MPPSTAARAWVATRVRLLSGCCGVSETPAVWVWKRIQVERSLRGPVALGHELPPDPPRRPELGDLLEEVGVAVEEERQARGEVVDAKPAGERGLDVGHAVGDREGQLLDRRRPRPRGCGSR